MPLFKRKRVNKTPKITDEPTPETIVTVEQGSEEAVVEEQVEDTEVPMDQRVANLKGGADPIMEVSTKPPEINVKGGPDPITPIPTKKSRANFKGAPMPTEPPGPNPEEPTGPKIEGVPWAYFEIKNAAIPGTKARKNGKQRERHYKYTRTHHELTSSCKRCVGIYLPTIYDDRAPSRRVRRDNKRRLQSHNGHNYPPTGY